MNINFKRTAFTWNILVCKQCKSLYCHFRSRSIDLTWQIIQYSRCTVSHVNSLYCYHITTVGMSVYTHMSTVALKFNHETKISLKLPNSGVKSMDLATLVLSYLAHWLVSTTACWCVNFDLLSRVLTVNQSIYTV